MISKETVDKREREREYVCGVGRRGEWKAWKDLSVGTGIEPQRNPTGLGVAISNVPTQRSSREFSDGEDNLAMGLRPQPQQTTETLEQ